MLVVECAHDRALDAGDRRQAMILRRGLVTAVGHDPIRRRSADDGAQDPERLLVKGPDTESSPKREMTAFQLTRYLDYCSELLSIISKIGAVYVQHFDDAATVDAASSVEGLTVGLSRKVWQKIIILDRMVGGDVPKGIG